MNTRREILKLAAAAAAACVPTIARATETPEPAELLYREFTECTTLGGGQWQGWAVDHYADGSTRLVRFPRQ